VRKKRTRGGGEGRIRAGGKRILASYHGKARGLTAKYEGRKNVKGHSMELKNSAIGGKKGEECKKDRTGALIEDGRGGPL